MIAPTRYLLWARRYFGRIPFDLATSGMERPSADELGPLGALDNLIGPERLRAAIAAFNAVSPDEVIATLGTTQALFIAYAALTSPGDDVLVEEPGYEPLWRIPEGLGAKVVRFERPVHERFALDPARVARAMTVRTRVVAITNLHNPGGVRVSDDVIRELARLCEQRGAHLLVDEVYAPFDALEETPRSSAGPRDTITGGVWSASARNLGPNVVTTSSLTKCFGLGLERIGWILGPPDVIDRADAAMMCVCGHLPIQHANLGVAVFSRIEALADRARRINAGKRARVEAWIATRPELSWSAPDSGLFGFATTAGAGDLTPALEVGARDHGVLAAAGSFFGVPNGFRLSWAIRTDRLDEALSRLGDVLPKG